MPIRTELIRGSKAALVLLAFSTVVWLGTLGLAYNPFWGTAIPLQLLDLVLLLAMVILIASGCAAWVSFLIRSGRLISAPVCFMLCSGIGLLVLIPALNWLHARAYDSAVDRTIARAQLLLHAIRSFSDEHNAPPNRLEELIPKYIERIPKSGSATFSGFEYTRNQGPWGDWQIIVHTPGWGVAGRHLEYWSNEDYPTSGSFMMYTKRGNWAKVMEFS